MLYQDEYKIGLDPEVFGILPPFRIQKTQARKRSHQRATQRQPSGFERTNRMIGSNKCSHCRETGHDQSWCPSRAIIETVESSNEICPMNKLDVPPPPRFMVMNTLPPSRFPVFDSPPPSMLPFFETTAPSREALQEMPMAMIRPFPLHVLPVSRCSSPTPSPKLFPTEPLPKPFLRTRQRCTIYSHGCSFYSTTLH